MSITIGQLQAVDAQARLANIQAIATANASVNAALVVKLSPLAVAGSLSGHQSAAVVSRLSLVTAANLGAAQHLAAVSWIGPLRTSVHVQATNVNTVTAVVKLPPLRASASIAGQASVHAVSLLRMAAAGSVSASQALHAASIIRLSSVQAITAASTARITATLGPLATSITAQPPPSGYAAEGHFYAAIPARPFYAALASRSFYAAIPARPFYILSNPNMTPIFDALDPRETMVLTLDATADLASGETLTAISTMTATQQSGIAGTLPTLSGQIINSAPLSFVLNGRPVTIAASKAVQVSVTGGVSGASYLIAATCTTSNAQKVLTPKAILPVSSN